MLRSWFERPVVLIPLVIALLSVLALAVMVVMRNISRVQIGPSPLVISPVPVDTTMSRVRRQLNRGITRLERRLYGYRDKVPELTSEQKDFFQSCSLGLVELRERFAAVESAQGYQERKERFTDARKFYSQLRERVNRFVRLVDSLITPAMLDSLDEEFQKFVSE